MGDNNILNEHITEHQNILNNNIMTVHTLANQFYELVECEAHEIYHGDITPHDMDNYTKQIVEICKTIQVMYERGALNV